MDADSLECRTTVLEAKVHNGLRAWEAEGEGEEEKLEKEEGEKKMKKSFLSRHMGQF